MMWQNEALFKSSNHSREVLYRFTSGCHPKYLNVYLKKGPKDLGPELIRIAMVQEKRDRDNDVWTAAERVCEHMKISLANVSTVARDIRNLIKNVL